MCLSTPAVRDGGNKRVPPYGGAIWKVWELAWSLDNSVEGVSPGNYRKGLLTGIQVVYVF